MTGAAAIDIRDASKHYPVFQRPADGIRYLWSAVVGGRPEIAAGTPTVRALEHVTLRVRRGERVGVIGRNGAGKSTLLKMLAGDFPPTHGRVDVDGMVYSLLPGSVGFSPDLSAAENARNYLAHFDLSEEEVAQRLEDIEAFTELGEYFHQPVKNYSLGMQVRAEFAVATSQYADIIVIDEVLGAGDIYWAEKIAARMDRLCERGITLLLVSHALDQIMRFCSRVIWIERGRVAMDGPTLEVTRRYESFLEQLGWHTDDADDKTIDVEQVLPALGNASLAGSGQQVVRWPGRGDIAITGVWLDGRPLTEMAMPADRVLGVRIVAVPAVSRDFVLRYTLTFWDLAGKRVAVVENEGDAVSLHAGADYELAASIRPGQLLRGEYLMTISLFDLAQSGSAAHEQSSRQDVIYKSFRISAPQGPVGQPLFRIPLQEST